MIKHVVDYKEEPIIHKVNYHISRKELQRIRALFSLYYDQWNAERLSSLYIVKGTYENILSVEFDDGAMLDINLHYGDFNCYDDVLFQNSEGVSKTLDCSYDLDNIEIYTGTNIYCVTLVVEDE